jgi:hypothetical protein
METEQACGGIERKVAGPPVDAMYEGCHGLGDEGITGMTTRESSITI